MKVLGIVGGIGPESTVEYYRAVIRLCRRRAGPDAYPPVVVNSINVTTMLGMLQAGRTAETVRYIAAAVESLARAGAQIGLIASNTPHMVFDEIARESPIPLLSIVDAACEASRAQGLRRLGLLGTRLTMEGGFYQRRFAAAGMQVAVPGEADRRAINDRYLAEWAHGTFADGARSMLMAAIDRLVAEQAVDGVILGGTELPLVLGGAKHEGIPLLDTTRIHAERAVAAILE